MVTSERHPHQGLRRQLITLVFVMSLFLSLNTCLCFFFGQLSLFLSLSFVCYSWFLLISLCLCFGLSLFIFGWESVSPPGVFHESQPLDRSTCSHERSREFSHWNMWWHSVTRSQAAATTFEWTMERPVLQRQTSNKTLIYYYLISFDLI